MRLVPSHRRQVMPLSPSSWTLDTTMQGQWFSLVLYTNIKTANWHDSIDYVIDHVPIGGFGQAKGVISSADDGLSWDAVANYPGFLIIAQKTVCSPTPSQSPSQTMFRSMTGSQTVSPAQSSTQSPTVSLSQTSSQSQSSSQTQTLSQTQTQTQTLISSQTQTQTTQTQASSQTLTLSQTQSASQTQTKSQSLTSSQTQSATGVRHKHKHCRRLRLLVRRLLHPKRNPSLRRRPSRNRSRRVRHRAVARRRVSRGLPRRRRLSQELRRPVVHLRGRSCGTPLPA